MGDHTVGNSLDITGDGTEDGAVARKPTADTVRQLDFARHQGQVGHCSRQVQLESRLGASEVAGLANAQLDQSGQSVLDHHASRSIFVIPGALLQRTGLLQESLLGMDQHPPSLPALGRDALRPQGTCHTFGPVELEGLQVVDPTRGIRTPSRWHYGVGDLPCRTGATARHQVDDKVILGKALPVGPSRHPGNQGAARVGEGLPGSSVS